MRSRRLGYRLLGRYYGRAAGMPDRIGPYLRDIQHKFKMWDKNKTYKGIAL